MIPLFQRAKGLIFGQFLMDLSQWFKSSQKLCMDPAARHIGDAGETNSTMRPGASWEERGTPVMKRSLLRTGQKGQGLVEYSLIIALVAIVVIAILVLMGPQIGQIFSTITNGL